MTRVTILSFFVLAIYALEPHPLSAFYLCQPEERTGGGISPPSIKYRITPSSEQLGVPFTYSSDGKLLAVPARQSIKLYDSNTGKSAGELFADDRWKKDWLGNVYFSSDSRTLAARTIGSNRIRIWDLTTFKQKAIITDSVDNNFSSPRGKMIATIRKTKFVPFFMKDEKMIDIWDMVTGQLKKSFELPGSPHPLSMEFSPDGKTFIVSSVTGRIFVYETDSWTLLERLKKQSEDASPVIGFIFSPDSQYVALVGISSIVAIHDMETFERVAWLKGHKKRIEQVEFSPDGELIATTSGDGTAKIWNEKTGQLKTTLNEQTGAVRFVSFSQDGRWLATSGTKREKVELLDTQTLKVKVTFDSSREAYAVFSPDGQSLAISNKDGSITVWDISTVK